MYGARLGKTISVSLRAEPLMRFLSERVFQPLHMESAVDADFGPFFLKSCSYFPVRHEAPRNRVEVRHLHRQVVAAA